MRPTSATAKRGLTLSLCSILCLACLGCISTGSHTILASDPQTTTDIERFELARNKVTVYGRFRLPEDQRCEEVTVRLNKSFEAEGRNCRERWMLKDVQEEQATFDVRGRYYGCTDLIAILFATPSRVSHWTVSVKRSEQSGIEIPSPDWFRQALARQAWGPVVLKGSQLTTRHCSQSSGTMFPRTS